MALLRVDKLCKAFAAASASASASSSGFGFGFGFGFGWRPARRPDAMRVAVDEVAFHIERGEAVGLTGPSGCGKSTLAGIVARVADADSGVVVFDGIDIALTPARRAASAPWRRRIQMVSQDALDSLDPRRTAGEAIADPLRVLCGLDGDALQARVESIAERVLLSRDSLARLPHQLSGGQGARVAIARALAVEPDLLILDEPTASLDTITQAAILTLLDGLRRDLGTSLLLVSHDVDVVRLMCARVLRMENGRLQR
ncbi:MAG: appF [Rhizobacter sp.]|nr:appF [Rhizobacter sp.]